MKLRRFLTTRWSHLAMLNYEIDPAILRPYVPAGTELDEFKGRHYVSMVGFLYHDTRVLGLAIPGHRDFAEVNLRYYVRYRAAEGWRRGVAFIKEIVPHRAVAWVACKLYDERFCALPMRHAIEWNGDGPTPNRVEYAWQYDREWQQLALVTSGRAELPPAGSAAEFITEHYWGYTARRDGTTSEYRVEHPKWRVTHAADSHFDCDIASVYGASFVEALTARPASAFLAEGSHVVVYRGVRLPHSYVQRYAVSSATFN